MTLSTHVAAMAGAAIFGAFWGAAGSAAGSDCEQTSIGLVPISDLAQGLYLGQFEGGLFPGGLNVPPPGHAAVGLAHAGAIEPLAANGAPDAGGKYVLLSIGMSNTTQEFCAQSGTDPCHPWTFMGQAAGHPDVEAESLVIANGAWPGQAAQSWASPDAPIYDQVRDTILATLGVTEAQVQAVWIKQATPGPTVSLPDADANAYVLEGLLGDVVRAVRIRYPNVRIAFLSSRIYAGYATSPLNPEPYAYETGFSVKWLIEAQIAQAAGGGVDRVAGDLSPRSAPWLTWGPYLWADGLIPRSDGLTWTCADMQNDGTHPATSGEEKVGTALLDFFLDDPFAAPWFRAVDDPACPADVTGDGTVDVQDIVAVILAWGPCPGSCDDCPADVTGDCEVAVADLIQVILNAGGCS